MGIYASMAVAAFIGLVWQMKWPTWRWRRGPIGAVFTFIALVTGSAWETDVGHLVGMGCTSDF